MPVTRLLFALNFLLKLFYFLLNKLIFLFIFNNSWRNTMTIFQIKCFLNVAEYLNFTEAANHLFVAQSSLSRNISNLEEELGMQLFVRHKQIRTPHPLWCGIIRRIFKIIKIRGSCVQTARNAELGENGSIVLGVIETQRSENFLPHTLHALREKHPNIKIDIISGNFQELRESLMNGKIDIALTLDFDLIDYPTDDIIYQVSSNQHQNVSFQGTPTGQTRRNSFRLSEYRNHDRHRSCHFKRCLQQHRAVLRTTWIYTVQYHLRILHPEYSVESRSRTGILRTGRKLYLQLQYCGAVIAILQDRSTASRRCLEKKQPKSGHSAVQ